MLQIAKVLKSNGTDGDILLGFKTIQPEDIDTKEPVYIYFDGLPVPFFIESFTKKGSDKAIAHLNDINCLRDAEEIAGQAVYADYLEEIDDEDDFSALEGWAVNDAEGNTVGTVSQFIDIPANPCLEVETKNGAAIIPLHEDLIISLDQKARILEMEIPDGLLDL
ncbi:MAG: hypothetical protein MJY80_07160 [Bacteroidales bacterium]|nr:hypothetical protein [Bacteroidales bacterium]